VNSSEHDADFDPFANESKKNKSPKTEGGSGSGVGWLALLLALLAIGYNGYEWWQSRSADSQDNSRQLAINNLRQSQSGFDSSLQALQDRLARAEQQDDSGAVTVLRSDITSLQQRISELGLNSAGDTALLEAVQITLSDMGQRISDTETSVAALAVRSDTPGKRMDLAEVDYLLRLASERLALFSDVSSADKALELADTQLEALDDPLYLPVRRRISESRAELQGLPLPDVVQISAQIAGLQSSIGLLPFPGETPKEVIVTDQVDATLWQRVKNALKPLVTVRRRVDESQELSLDDKDILSQGLWLQLESARLAIMRNDPVAWDLSLARARSSLTNRYDGDSRQVVEALSAIRELSAVPLAGDLPDVSGAWRQLRLLREGSAKQVPEEQQLVEPVADGVDPVE
jgi:uroporphyrin-3 C-methyltransferase